MILVATRSISLREGLLALLAAISPSQTFAFVGSTAEVLEQLSGTSVDPVMLDADLLGAEIATTIERLLDI